MNTIEIVGFKREKTGTTVSRNLRREGTVPCVVYGEGEQCTHFHSPLILFRELLNTTQVYFVKLNIEGVVRTTILQDCQFHPVTGTLLHADFLVLSPQKYFRVDVPTRLIGLPQGVQKGGRLVHKLKKLKVRSKPDSMPSFVPVEVSKLDVGQSLTVGDLESPGYEILNSPPVSVVTVEIPRALKGKLEEEVQQEPEAST